MKIDAVPQMRHHTPKARVVQLGNRACSRLETGFSLVGASIFVPKSPMSAMKTMPMT